MQPGWMWPSCTAERREDRRDQAIGRVIRHVRDYGAVLLFESRFKLPKYREGLSVWLRAHVRLDRTNRPSGGAVREQLRCASRCACLTSLGRLRWRFLGSTERRLPTAPPPSRGGSPRRWRRGSQLHRRRRRRPPASARICSAGPPCQLRRRRRRHRCWTCCRLVAVPREQSRRVATDGSALQGAHCHTPGGDSFHTPVLTHRSRPMLSSCHQRNAVPSCVCRRRPEGKRAVARRCVLLHSSRHWQLCRRRRGKSMSSSRGSNSSRRRRRPCRRCSSPGSSRRLVVVAAPSQPSGRAPTQARANRRRRPRPRSWSRWPGASCPRPSSRSFPELDVSLFFLNHLSRSE